MKYEDVVEKVSDYLCNSEFVPPEERASVILRLLQSGDDLGRDLIASRSGTYFDRSYVEDAARQAAAQMRERCAAIAKAHKGSAAKRRKAKELRLSDCDNWEEIEAEERGEDIAAEMMNGKSAP